MAVTYLKRFQEVSLRMELLVERQKAYMPVSVDNIRLILDIARVCTNVFFRAVYPIYNVKQYS